MIVNGANGDPSDPAVFARALATGLGWLALPQIAEAGRAPYVFMSEPRTQRLRLGQSRSPRPTPMRFARSTDRSCCEVGSVRLDRPDEAVVDDRRCRQLHAPRRQPGDVPFVLGCANASVRNQRRGEDPVPGGAPVHVPGRRDCARSHDDRHATGRRSCGTPATRAKGRVLLSPAFLRQFARRPGRAPGSRTRHGGLPGSAPAWARRSSRVRAGGAPASSRPGDGQVHLGSDIQTAADKAQRPIHLEAIALALFGAIIGLAALLILGQALVRQVAADTDDHATLAALGADRRHLVAVPLARAVVIAVGGAVVAGSGGGCALAAHTDRSGPTGRDPPRLLRQRGGARLRVPLRLSPWSCCAPSSRRGAPRAPGRTRTRDGAGPVQAR